MITSFPTFRDTRLSTPTPKRSSTAAKSRSTPEEVAYFYKRIERQQEFFDARSEKTGESDFTIFNL